MQSVARRFEEALMRRFIPWLFAIGFLFWLGGAIA
jgi:hypothetical protein